MKVEKLRKRLFVKFRSYFANVRLIFGHVSAISTQVELAAFEFFINLGYIFHGNLLELSFFAKKIHEFY